MKGFILSILSVLMLLSSPLKAKNFPLRINDVSKLNSSWPLIGSLAFSEGELKNPSAIRIMSGDSEVPSQVDVAATWRDGSIRWALAGFTASPQGEYSVEYGSGVKRGVYPNPLKVTNQADGGFTVDTGAAVYQFDSDKILPENGWLVSARQKIQILKGSGAGAYLIDNTGRTARAAGTPAEIENEVLKEGPGRFVVKRSGWYVTQAGEKLARAEVWLYFSAGTPYVKITHSIIFTEDTNRVWFKDYGLEFKTPDKPLEVYCAVGENADEIRKIKNEGEEIFLLQTEYPHFAEREYKAVIGKSAGGKDTPIADIKIAGDWAHGDYGNYGITLVMPWLAERFPKELSFGERGARAVLWSGRSGKELDFRGKTLVKEYWQSWAEKGPGSPGAEKLSAFESNAQGSARTHDIWFLPHAGAYKEKEVRQTAVAGARTPLVTANPLWLCETEAMGYPMLHKDTARFPEEEAVLSEYWQRFILPLKAFSLTGFIDWGDFPTWQYNAIDGRIMAKFHILTNIDRYSVRREPWCLFARSGERDYYNYAHRFSRFSGDWYLVHEDVPGSTDRKRGSFMSFSAQGGKLPFAWGQRGHLYITNGGDIGCWLLEYYLTGDERSLSLLKMIKESVKKYWKVDSAIGVNQSKVVRELVTLSIMDWDKDIMGMAKEVAHSMFDLESQNGIKMFKNSYGPMYKDQRTCHNTVEYYLETKDELAKEVFLKLMDHLYRFDRRGSFATYKNYSGFTGALAYWMTGDERHRRVVEQGVGDAVRYIKEYPLSEDLKKLPENPLDWKRMPAYLGIWEWHNPFIGLPTALKLLAEKGWSGGTTPLIVKCMKQPEAKIIFLHKKGVDTTLSIYLQTDVGVQPGIPEIVSCDGGKKIQGIKAEFEKRMPQGPYFEKRPDVYPKYSELYHTFVTVPAEIPGGLYLLSTGEHTTFTLLDINMGKAALYCPEGFWPVSVGEHISHSSYGRYGEGMPIFFRVPSDLKELEIFLSSSACVKRPDGSVAVSMSKENTGRMAIPVEGKGGIWSIEPYIHNARGECFPGFYRLFNVEPIVAYGSPDLLPDGITGLKPVPDNMRQASGPMEFADGISGKSLRLAEGKTLAFTRGEKLQQGGYSYFPGMTGTAEFWFRADCSTRERILFPFTSTYMPFLHGPHIDFLQKYWSMGSARSLFSRLQLELATEQKGVFGTGFQVEYFFKAGEWTHIAYTWDIKEGEKGTEGECAIFVNGKKLPYKGASYGVKPLTGQQKIKLLDKETDIVLGPFEGSMDNLRLSDIVRYKEDFTPVKTPPAMDTNTRVLFLFDGNLKGTSAFSWLGVEAKH